MNPHNPSFLPAERIASFGAYYFATLGKKINALRARGIEVIRLDMGSPDLPPASFIIDTLAEAAHRSDAHGYSPYGGTPAFKKACATYYQNRFGVDLDPNKEILALIGSKEGLFNLSQVLINPGDYALVPDPGYPTYSAGTMIAGGRVYPMPLVEGHGFLPDLDDIPMDVIQKTKILWINYPNNPTGAIANLDFFRKVIDFAHQNNILVAHDAPYTEIGFDGYCPPSLMQVEGAKEVAIEFNSLSKAYNMGGWRLGMAVGNPQVIEYLSTYKSQVDSSSFGPLLEAGQKALTGDQSWIVARNKTYEVRRDIVVEALENAGLEVQRPRATIYVWAHTPQGQDSTTFCERLLEEAGVSTTPGVVYGKQGEGYLRISLGIATDSLRIAMDRLVEWMRAKA